MIEHHVFVSTERPADEVRAVIEAELRAAFRASEDADPVLAMAIRTTNVFFHDNHEFEDDHDFTVSRYRHWIGIKDSARDEERQLTVAQRVFDAMKDQGWATMLSRNLQGNIAVYR